MKKYIWDISTQDSSLNFKVKYFRISNILGCFLRFEGKIITEESFKNPEISISIESDSIQTWNKIQDEKLRSFEYLNSEEFPYIKFSSTGGCRESSGGIWELSGELVIKSISKPITLVVSFTDIKENQKNPKALFYLFGKINRRDFQFINSEDVGEDIYLNGVINLFRKN